MSLRLFVSSVTDRTSSSLRSPDQLRAWLKEKLDGARYPLSHTGIPSGREAATLLCRLRKTLIKGAMF